MKTPPNEKAVPFKSSRYWLGEINKVGMLASLIDGLEQAHLFEKGQKATRLPFDQNIWLVTVEDGVFII